MIKQKMKISYLNKLNIIGSSLFTWDIKTTQKESELIYNLHKKVKEGYKKFSLEEKEIVNYIYKEMIKKGKLIKKEWIKYNAINKRNKRIN